jgi:hypothetical protein
MLSLHIPAASSAGTALGCSIGRRELFIWVAAILAANCLLRVDASSAAQVPAALVQALGSRSAFQYLAWYALFRLLADSNRTAPASSTDIAFALFATLVPFFPMNPLVWLSATATAAYLLATRRGDGKLGAAGIVLLALAINGLWARQFFDVFALFLLRADAAVVAAALSLTQPGIIWHDTLITSPGHSIVIFGPCSSFHNLSLSLLCWVALSKLGRTAWAPRDAFVALLIFTTVVLFNSVRLYFMALSPEQYAYWHSGFGEQLFAWTTPAAVIAISLWGSLQNLRPR